MPTPSTITTALAIENLFFIAVHSRTHLINKPLGVYGRNIFDLRKSYFSIYSRQHGLVAPMAAGSTAARQNSAQRRAQRHLGDTMRRDGWLLELLPGIARSVAVGPY